MVDKHMYVLNMLSSKIKASLLLLDWADAQAVPSFCWAHK